MSDQSFVSKKLEGLGPAVMKKTEGIVQDSLNSAITYFNSQTGRKTEQTLQKVTERLFRSAGLGKNPNSLGNRIAAKALNTGINAGKDLARDIVNKNLRLDNLKEFSLRKVLSGESGLTDQLGGIFGIKPSRTGKAGEIANNVKSFSALVGANEKGLSEASASQRAGITSEDPNGDRESYAQLLAKWHPKLPFLFIVQFEFNSAFKGLAQQNTVEFAVMVNKCDRPGYQINHDEVNMYNFKTHVPKSVTFPPIKMQFLDDVTSATMNFLIGYMRLISPITGLSTDDSRNRLEQGSFDYAQQSLSSSYFFSDNESSTSISILKNINIYHVTNGGKNMDKYTLIRPRIQEINFSDLTMETTSASVADLTINFDSVYTEPGLPATGLSNLFIGNFKKMQEVLGGTDLGGDLNGALASTNTKSVVLKSNPPLDPIAAAKEKFNADAAAPNFSFMKKAQDAITNKASNLASNWIQQAQDDAVNTAQSKIKSKIGGALKRV